MIQTFLITGGTYEERFAYIQNECKTWNVKTFDQSLLRKKDEEKDSIGIGDVRAWQKTLSLTPHGSPYTVGIIPDAHTLTLEAQHALLKTLEEPPEHVRIFLETDMPATLIATIISRTTVKTVGNHTMEPFDKEKTLTFLTSLPSLGYGGIVRTVDTSVEKKSDATKLLTDILSTFHMLLTTEGKETPGSWKHVRGGNYIRSVLKAQNKLTANVNYRLVVDELLFTFLALQSPK